MEAKELIRDLIRLKVFPEAFNRELTEKYLETKETIPPYLLRLLTKRHTKETETNDQEAE